MLRVETVFDSVSASVSSRWKWIKLGIGILALLLYNIYFFGAVYHAAATGKDIDW